MSDNTYKIILATATPGSPNRGCDALAITAIDLIDKVFTERGDKYVLYLADSTHKSPKKHKIIVHEKAIYYYDCDYPIGFTIKEGIKVLAKKILNKSYNTNIWKEADYILCSNGGDSFTDIYGCDWFDVIDRAHKTARFYSKPYCLLPQTIGPFTDKKVILKACKSMQMSDLVMCRDAESLDCVKKISPNRIHVKSYIDIAFFLPYEKWNFNRNKVHVGLNISGLLWNGGYVDKQFCFKSDYKEIIKEIIHYFEKHDEVVLHLVSHVLLDRKYVENDYEVSYNLYKSLNSEKTVLAPFFLDAIEAKSYISGLDFFIGARMHATIAAFSSGVPVVPMAYSRKFSGLFKATLDYDNIVDLRKESVTDAISVIDNAFRYRNLLKDTIDNRLNTRVQSLKNKVITDLNVFFRKR